MTVVLRADSSIRCASVGPNGEEVNALSLVVLQAAPRYRNEM